MAKLLYIEDNDDNVYMLTMRFEVHGKHQVVVAENGEIGLVKAIEQRPDLILLDMDLPVLSGWEVVRRLKRDPATRTIPVIALTSHAMTGSREKALAAGCDEYESKPIDFDRLVESVRRLLDRGTQNH